jgi:hypothetical protein
MRIQTVQQGTDKGLKECQRHPVTDQIEQDEATAGARYVPDQSYEVSLREMMRHAYRNRDIGVRERVTDRIAGKYGDRCIGGSGVQIETHYLRAQFAADPLKKRAMPATNIQHTMDRERIAPQ